MQRSPKGCKKAEDTNDQSETLSSMIHRDRSTGGSLYFGTWYFDPTKLIKIRFHLTDRRRDGMEGWIAWKRAAEGPLPPCWNWIWRCVMLVEFPWAGINWKRIDLTLNADISTRLHICKLKFARLIVHGPFSLPSPTPPLVPIQNLSRKPSFPTIEFTFSFVVWVWSVDSTGRNVSTDGNVDRFYGFELCLCVVKKYRVNSWLTN